ncbi:MAG: hypothetical protein SLAVMIC_00365 [uncultured marine phage]|uniref:Uncharacterized protein n=1 Tax=uncultured marine phage TaxID=707152 RepID=A0A8D9C8S9_9VIRU|nr:MAG: hypothetical protein SLAVMIC_00365 [uncultured marine phage]
MKYLLTLLSVFLLNISFTQGFLEDPVYDSLVRESIANYDTTFVDYFVKYKPKYSRTDSRDYTNIYIYHCTFVDSMGLKVSQGKFSHKKKKVNKEVVHQYTKVTTVNGVKIKTSLFRSRLSYGYRIKYKKEGESWKDVIPLNFTEKNGYLIMYNDVMNQAKTSNIVDNSNNQINVYNYYGYNSFVMESVDDLEEKLVKISILWYLSLS